MKVAIEAMNKARDRLSSVTGDVNDSKALEEQRIRLRLKAIADARDAVKAQRDSEIAYKVAYARMMAELDATFGAARTAA